MTASYLRRSWASPTAPPPRPGGPRCARLHDAVAAAVGGRAKASGCRARRAARTCRRRATRRSRGARLARARRAGRRRAPAPLGRIPRVRRRPPAEAVEAEVRRSVVLAGALGPDGPTGGGADASAGGVRAPRGGCHRDSPSQARATDVPSTTAATWPPGLAAAGRAAMSRWDYLSAAVPRLPVAVASARAAAARDRRVVVANYLLAPGYFDDLTRAAGRRRARRGRCSCPTNRRRASSSRSCSTATTRHPPASAERTHFGRPAPHPPSRAMSRSASRWRVNASRPLGVSRSQVRGRLPA